MRGTQYQGTEVTPNLVILFLPNACGLSPTTHCSLRSSMAWGAPGKLLGTALYIRGEARTDGRAAVYTRGGARTDGRAALYTRGGARSVGRAEP